MDPLDVPRKGVEVHRMLRIIAPLTASHAVVVRVSGIWIQAIDPKRLVRLRLKAAVEARHRVKLEHLVFANIEVDPAALRSPDQTTGISLDPLLLGRPDLLRVIARFVRVGPLPLHQVNLSL